MTNPIIGQQNPLTRYILHIASSPARILGGSLVISVTLTTLSMVWLMHPPWQDIATLFFTLLTTSTISLGSGFYLYKKGWVRSRSIGLTLIFTSLLSTFLGLINVWIIARLMFADSHDIVLAVTLLMFQSIIIITYGTFVAANVTEGLENLATTATELKSGNLAARVNFTGEDEIAQVSQIFNEMAGQLQEMVQEKKEIEHLRRDLIAWTSHDLRTPLTAIRARVEALCDGIIDDKATIEQYYRAIHTDVLALNRLIDDLFELAQIDAGGIFLKISTDSLRDLISDALESFQAIAKKKHIYLEGDIRADVDAILMNAPKIGRVLANLISNAITYAPSHGEVHIVVEKQPHDEAIKVSISDNGPGFDPKDLPRVFEKFYRGELSRTRAKGNAGLGLAIAKGIIDAHGGQIWASNAPNGGAVVTFTLPQKNLIKRLALKS